MISGTIFSMADLGGFPAYLYGKVKIGKEIFDVECLEEHETEGTTEVMIKQTKEQKEVKTSKIFDLEHSNIKLW